MTASVDQQAVVGARLESQLLAGRSARSAEEVVGRLLAVQAQDPRGFRLSVRSRSTGLVVSDVDDALGRDRSLVVTWLNRGTLHLVRAGDYWWLHDLTAPKTRTMNSRRLRQEGVSEVQTQRAVDVIVAAVTTDGPQTREQLRRRLDAAGVPTAGQALVHVLLAASLTGAVVRGPVIGKDQAYVSTAQWLGAAPASLERSQALGLVARRYLQGHSPAATHDLAKWAGIPLREAQAGFDVIARELRAFAGGLTTLRRFRRSRVHVTRLLGPFDPLLHGWASRAPFVGSHEGVVTTNGIFRPVALAGGRVVGTWSLAGGVVSITALEPIEAVVRDALVEDANNVRRFLGLADGPTVVKES